MAGNGTRVHMWPVSKYVTSGQMKERERNNRTSREDRAWNEMVSDVSRRITSDFEAYALINASWTTNWLTGTRDCALYACATMHTRVYAHLQKRLYRYARVYMYIYVCITSSLRISRRYVASTTPVASFYRVTHYSWATVGRPYVTNRPPYGYKVNHDRGKRVVECTCTRVTMRAWINDRWTGLHKCRRGLNAGTRAYVHTCTRSLSIFKSLNTSMSFADTRRSV